MVRTLTVKTALAALIFLILAGLIGTFAIVTLFQIHDQTTQLRGAALQAPTPQLDLIDQSAERAIAAIILLLGLAFLFAVSLPMLAQRLIGRPLEELSASVERIARGDLDAGMEAAGDDELGALRQRLVQLREGLRQQRAEAQKQADELLREHGTLRQQLEELRQSQTAHMAMAHNVDQLSVPILPVLNGVLVAPIVGIVDEERAGHLQMALLQAIQEQSARVVILDLTGLITVDPLVIKTLLQSAQSATLLGARPIIVGITPEVAEVLVQLGVPLGGLQTMANLQAAVSFARTYIYKSKARA